MASPGCSDSDDNHGSAFEIVACEAGQFRLVGTVDGQAVNISEVASGGFAQGNTAVFDQNRAFGGVDPNPENTKVHLEWSGGLADGNSTGVSGTVMLPAGQPRSGETLCPSGDSRVGFSEDGRFGFALTSLTGGTDCSESVPGTLQAAGAPEHADIEGVLAIVALEECSARSWAHARGYLSCSGLLRARRRVSAKSKVIPCRTVSTSDCSGIDRRQQSRWRSASTSARATIRRGARVSRI
ncbi:MAG TPA: hypothetical protein VK524_03665 [Polyangiaceae bacterium]|nr:hypothetical protein [Polyangiaceae bacterium]